MGEGREGREMGLERGGRSYKGFTGEREGRCSEWKLGNVHACTHGSSGSVGTNMICEGRRHIEGPK